MIEIAVNHLKISFTPENPLSAADNSTKRVFSVATSMIGCIEVLLSNVYRYLLGTKLIVAR